MVISKAGMIRHRISPRPPLAAAALSLLLVASLFPLSMEKDPQAGALLKAFLRSADRNGTLAREWNAKDPDPCPSPSNGWPGVLCDGQSKVYLVNLTGINLGGVLAPGTLGGIPTLTNLTLHGTNLSGKIPRDVLGNPVLQVLDLSSNRLSGSLVEMGAATELLHLDLANNLIKDSIPPINESSKLLRLRLENNQLQGDLLGIQITSLIDFNVSGNGNLTGRIPNTLATKFGASAFYNDSKLCGQNWTQPCDAAAAPAKAPHKRERRLTAGGIAGIMIGDIFILFLITACFYVHYSKKYQKAAESQEKPVKKGKGAAAAGPLTIRTDPYTSTVSVVSDSFLESSVSVAKAGDASAAAAGRGSLVFFEGHSHTFELEDLLRASAEMLGKGSFGTAYKAVLDGGGEVAVKRLRDLRDSGRKEFEQQMELVGKLRHANLVPLKAYYYAREEKLLVYDYQPNGSVYTLLHGNRQSSDRVPLDWAMRLRIALGVARGLEYLHKECESQKIPHGNIKSSNILMDKHYQPCITDFGLAPLMTTSMASSRLVGYRAPEYSQSKRITQKADVYSFGVLLLELLTGRIPAQVMSNGSNGDPGIDLPRWVHSVVREEWTAEVFDLELMRYPNIEEEMVILLQIAMKCVVGSADSRPKMSEVVKQIEDIRGPDPYSDNTDYQDSLSDISEEPTPAASPAPFGPKT